MKFRKRTIKYTRTYQNITLFQKVNPDIHSIHSTVTALAESTDSWAFKIDRGNVNAVV